MDRLQEQFGDRVEFLRLNVDHKESREKLSSLGIRGRSHYVLMTTDGDFLGQWSGPISGWEEAMVAEIDKALSTP